ncbi:MAG: DinB family protein [Actinomycetota bacterium]
MPHGPDPRVDSPRQVGEREMLENFLDFYRETILWKVSGMSEEDLRRVIVPSGWSPLGMVKHLAYVEQNWFRSRLAGEQGLSVPWTDEDPDADMRAEPDESTDEIIKFYRDQCERSRSIAAGAALDDLAAEWPADRPPEKRPNLRWIYVHMIEETARHAGHLDVVRELIDGAVGD